MSSIAFVPMMVANTVVMNYNHTSTLEVPDVRGSLLIAVLGVLP